MRQLRSLFLLGALFSMLALIYRLFHYPVAVQDHVAHPVYLFDTFVLVILTAAPVARLLGLRLSKVDGDMKEDLGWPRRATVFGRMDPKRVTANILI